MNLKIYLNQSSKIVKTSIAGLILSFSLLLSVTDTRGQVCTNVASCTPGAATNPLAGPFQTGLDQITLGPSLTLSGGRASAGYRNLKCNNFVSVTAGVPINFTATTSPNVNENLRIWVDWNNDETFDPVTELAVSSDNRRSHTGSFRPPISAVLDTVLRVRISTDNVASTLPTPCSTPEYGQVIDLGLVLVANSNPPIALFNATDSVTCTGNVQFNDQSLNVPTQWIWSFGDGSLSTVQNPSYTYTAPGRYTVRLIVVNTAGSDTLEKSLYITYRDSLPVASACVPAPLAPSPTYGIANFRFAGINTSAEGSTIRNGYFDWTCRYQSELYPGFTYPVSFLTGTQNQDTRIWIDLNNDGDFLDAGEEVYTSLNARNPSGFIITPNQVLLNERLRMRVISDFATSAFTSCGNITNGVIQDFTVYFRRNTNPPIASFAVNQPDFCAGNVSFTSTSIHAIDSLYWDFGNGQTAATDGNVKTVSTTYTQMGSYTVSLIVKGPYGVDTFKLAGAVNYFSRPLATCPQQRAGRPLATTGLYEVNIGNLNATNRSANLEGYRDATCERGARLIIGKRYSVRIRVGTANPEQVGGWIDLNNDGTLSSNERMFYMTGSGVLTADFMVPAGAVQARALRMRIMHDLLQPNINLAPCQVLTYGSVVDYSVVLFDSAAAPVALFGPATRKSCRKTVSFIDSSLNVPTSWVWHFGDGNTSTQQNPTHTYASAGSYTVKLVVRNQYGEDSLERSSVVEVLPFELKPATCAISVNNLCCNIGLQRITIGQQFGYTNNSYVARADNNLACEQIFEVEAGKFYPVAVTTFAARDNVTIYADFNNNGTFETTEQIFFSRGVKSHAGQIEIRGDAVRDSLLRFRVIHDLPFGIPPSQPCGPLTNGQVWDFGMIIKSGTQPPLARFTASQEVTCSGIVSFRDTASTIADSWFWEFGDGQTSTQPNPTHTYTAAGQYNVKLIVRNRFGEDTLEKPNYINVSGLWGPKPAICKPISNDTSIRYGIRRFRMATIDRSSQGSSEGYRDFTCSDSTKINLRQAVPVVMQLGPLQQLVRVFLDANNDGVFDNVELLVTAGGINTANFNIQVNTGFPGQLFNRYLRMRVIAHPSNLQFASACGPIGDGQAEDYSVYVSNVTSADQQLLESSFEASPNPTSDRLRIKLPVLDFATEQRATIKLVNQLGQDVWQTDHDMGVELNQDIDVSHLPAGIYTIRLSTASTTTVKRIVKQ